MINFIIVFSDLGPHVLNTQVKRGAEQSTTHHLVMSWVRWQGEVSGQTWQTQTCSDDELGASGGGSYADGLRSFSGIPVEVWGINQSG